MLRRTFLSLLTLTALTASVHDVAAQTVRLNRGQRDLLLFVKLAPSSGPSKAFYQFTEFAAETMAVSMLAGRYRRVHVVKGTAATRDRLVSTLNNIAANGSVRAVDCIFVTHGLSSRISFANGTSTIGAVRDAHV